MLKIFLQMGTLYVVILHDKLHKNKYLNILNLKVFVGFKMRSIFLHCSVVGKSSNSNITMNSQQNRIGTIQCSLMNKPKVKKSHEIVPLKAQ